jgi:hypothetical protein
MLVVLYIAKIIILSQTENSNNTIDNIIINLRLEYVNNWSTLSRKIDDNAKIL